MAVCRGPLVTSDSEPWLVACCLVTVLTAWRVPSEKHNDHVRHVSTYFGLGTSTLAFQNFECKFTLLFANNAIIVKNIVRTLSVLCLFVLGAPNSVGKKIYRVKTVVIDAGHGGHDAGALGRFSKEKDIALQIALKLGRLIKQHMKDVEVIYTRKTDKFISLTGRAKIANKHKSDVFISIHCNAAPKGVNAHGTEIYTRGGQHFKRSYFNLSMTKRGKKVILMEDNHQKTHQDLDPKSPASHILFSLYQNANKKNSLALAQSIHHQFKHRIGRKSKEVKQTACIMVLWKTVSPSVLLEVGFITHAEEEKYLNSKTGQAQIASSIFRGLRDYKQQLEASS